MPRTLEEMKQEVWGHFRPSQEVFLATAEVGQPRVRPVTLIDYDEKFWIATGTRSQKARQIRQNPNVEFCLPVVDGDLRGYIRVAGVADRVRDPDIRRSIGERFALFDQYWSGPDDPDYTLLRITRVEVEYLPPGESDAVTFMV